VGDEVYERYHDTEWGVPVHDDGVMFEFLVLESAQAGLSWRTVLGKREHYRKAFAGFNPRKVARFTSARVEKLMQNAGIIRNRAKIEATINNAKRFLEVQGEFGSFCAYAWGFVGGKPRKERRGPRAKLPATSAESDALARDLKRRGFKFLGSTICYAHMQAVGMVNDHTTNCFRYTQV
jgi:DNA-3-methyladenine glycosylase I